MPIVNGVEVAAPAEGAVDGGRRRRRHRSPKSKGRSRRGRSHTRRTRSRHGRSRRRH